MEKKYKMEDIVKRLLGSIDHIGETRHDGNVLDRLKGEYADTFYALFEDLKDCQHFNGYESSRKECAKQAMVILRNVYEDLKEIFDEAKQ